MFLTKEVDFKENLCTQLRGWKVCQLRYWWKGYQLRTVEINVELDYQRKCNNQEQWEFMLSYYRKVNRLRTMGIHAELLMKSVSVDNNGYHCWVIEENWCVLSESWYIFWNWFAFNFETKEFEVVKKDKKYNNKNRYCCKMNNSFKWY